MGESGDGHIFRNLENIYGLSLEDGETVLNAFPDRDYQKKKL